MQTMYLSYNVMNTKYLTYTVICATSTPCNSKDHIKQKGTNMSNNDWKFDPYIDLSRVLFGTKIATHRLLTAAEHGDTETLKQLIKDGVSPNLRDRSRWTALMYAARNGHLECCKILLDAGADMDAIGNEGNAAYLAHYYKHYDILELFIHEKEKQQANKQTTKERGR